MQEFKLKIVETGKKLSERGFSPGFSGNISARLEDKFLITPSGLSLGELTPNDIVIIDEFANKIEGNKKPSSESKMHTLIYKKRPEMNAIVHCHAPKSSVFAVAGIPLNQPILAENIFTLGDIPVAKYYLPSSDQLANEVSTYFSSSDAVLMQNHGVILAAKDLRQAYYKMETLEYYAEVCLFAKLFGEVKELTLEQKEEIIKLRESH